jgi:hypothetical protein
MKIKKTGHNKFAGYQFFELQDFVVPALAIFKSHNLTSVISFAADIAQMEIINCENPDERIVITSPMSEANLKGCHPIQNLGAVESYLRRYLWVTALEIVEHDALDSSEPVAEPVKKSKPVESKPAEKQTVQGADRDWQIKIEEITGEWQNGMHDATELILNFAESKDNVVKIFQTNRNLYDKLKEEYADIYADVMQLFTAAKAKFKE